MVWREGELPLEAPPFSALLTYDLLSYAYSLMTQGLRLLDQGSQAAAAREAFEHAASAIEAATARGPARNDRDFHRLMAGACYHLARYAARAFSLLHEGLNEANLSVPERALALLMLRDLDALGILIRDYRADIDASEDGMIAHLAAAEADKTDSIDDAGDEAVAPLLEVVDRALADNFVGALGVALLAFERGEAELIRTAVEQMKVGLGSAAELNLVPSWWCHRLAIHLLDDLWSSGFQARLPCNRSTVPPKIGRRTGNCSSLRCFAAAEPRSTSGPRRSTPRLARSISRTTWWCRCPPARVRPE